MTLTLSALGFAHSDHILVVSCSSSTILWLRNGLIYSCSFSLYFEKKQACMSVCVSGQRDLSPAQFKLLHRYVYAPSLSLL